MDPVTVAIVGTLTLLALLGAGGGYLYVYTLKTKNTHELSLSSKGVPSESMEKNLAIVRSLHDQLDARVKVLEASALAFANKKRRV